MKYLVINGPNLNRLGRRDTNLYGDMTLDDINELVQSKAKELGADLIFFQANSEGAIIDFLQANGEAADGIIINPGAYGHYSYSIHDALLDTGKPIAEVHLSNVYAREEWRHNLVISAIARGVITGFGWRGYLAALDLLIALREDKHS